MEARPMATDLLASLKTRLAKLEQTILDKDAKDHFLHPAKNWLDEIERKVAPGTESVMLPLIEEQLRKAEILVIKYGPNLRITG
jgi:hypothetical protein